jgi:NAD kinase
MRGLSNERSFLSCTASRDIGNWVTIYSSNEAVVNRNIAKNYTNFGERLDGELWMTSR